MVALLERTLSILKHGLQALLHGGRVFGFALEFERGHGLPEFKGFTEIAGLAQHPVDRLLWHARLDGFKHIRSAFLQVLKAMTEAFAQWSEDRGKLIRIEDPTTSAAA